MIELLERIDNARKAMRAITTFLSAPAPLLMEENQQRLAMVVGELQNILRMAAEMSDEQRVTASGPLHLLQGEIQLSRALALQAAGMFQSFEPSDSAPTLYGPSRWEDAARV